MTVSANPPSDLEVAAWLGNDSHNYWLLMTKIIAQNYPNLFTSEWLFGGKKHGWSLRYKKSRSFCTFIPEKNRFRLLIVFGAEERAKVETVREGLSPATQQKYDAATTYHDGKWLLLTIDNDQVVKDAMVLLAVKRRPKMTKGIVGVTA